MNYRQSVCTIQLKYIEDDFEYIIDTFSGEREENLKIIKINTCESQFHDINDIELNVSKQYIEELKKFLRSIKKDLETHDIRISILLYLHNERVRIDFDKEDNRSYGFLRLHFKDIENNIHIDDIPIISSDPEGLEEHIVYSIKKYINIHKIQSECKDMEFGSLPHILSPKASGYFIHEIIGHTLEADFYEYYKNKYENMNISKKLTVVDSIGNYNKLVGLNKFDDLGTPIEPLTLISDGKIQNILAIHNKDSFDQKLYGVARRESYKCDIFPRMRSTYIKPSDNMEQQDILNEYKDAIYINEAYLGSVNPQTGNYNIQGNGYVIKNGEFHNYIGKLQLDGNIEKDIPLLEYIGNDFQMFSGYCGKIGQIVHVGMGGPTISIASLNSKGRLYGKR